MSYVYAAEKVRLFTDEGSRDFIANRDIAMRMVGETGAFRVLEFLGKSKGSDTWFRIACLDRMVEMGDLVKLPRDCWQQYEVYTSPRTHNH